MTRRIRVPEMRKNVCLIAAPNDSEMFNRYSNYSKLLRVIVYCRRVRSANTFAGALYSREIDKAEIQILKNIQGSQYPDETKKLEKGESISKGRIANLNLFHDTNGLIRSRRHLNSPPPLSSDPNDLQALSPAHYLIEITNGPSGRRVLIYSSQQTVHLATHFQGAARLLDTLELGILKRVFKCVTSGTRTDRSSNTEQSSS